jgi:hypothetical protein
VRRNYFLLLSGKLSGQTSETNTNMNSAQMATGDCFCNNAIVLKPPTSYQNEKGIPKPPSAAYEKGKSIERIG